MTRVTSTTLLTQLQNDVLDIQRIVEQEFSHLSNNQLLEAAMPTQWSIAQCLDHLTSYGLYYLPLMERAIQTAEAKNLAAKTVFTSSWLGNYFATSMRPDANGRIRLKSKAVKNHTPADQPNAQIVLNEFLRQQAQLETLLDRAKAVDLAGSRIPISIARWIKLSLGDTFRFLIAHEQRHVLQAQRVLKALVIPTTTTPLTEPYAS